MVIQVPRTTASKDKAMSDTYVDQSKVYVRLLNRWYEPNAIARVLKVSSGTLQNLWRGRLKTIPVDIYMRLCEAVSKELRAEIGRLELELAMAEARAPRTSAREMATMVSQIEAMKTLLKERT